MLSVDLSGLFELAVASLDQLPHVLLDYLLYPLITLLMCLLSVFVVLGNLLVVTAIWHENQLHSVTNYLIASLAAADCLVGALVMPFSIISEMIIGSWTFGPTLCDLWHSFDVLASTASIMNLCAISLDRYLAITNPICYPTKMTPKRVALLIVSLWTCSSLISFPAILWWRAVGDGDGPLQQVVVASPARNSTSSSQRQLMIKNVISKLNNNELEPISQQQQQNSSSIQDNLQVDLIRANQLAEPPASWNAGELQDDEQVRFKCPFTDDTYYLLFSSFVSFYGPLCVMLYAYICIYRAAVQQTRFLKYGSKQVPMSGSGGGGGSSGAGGAGSGSHDHSSKRNKRHKLTAGQLDGQTGHLAEANCDNYEQQHLVLRVHRGGGGGNAAKVGETPSAASKKVKSQQRLKQQQKQRFQQQQQHLQTTPTDEDGDDEDEDESEPYKQRRGHLASSSLDRTSTLSDSFNGSGTRNSPPGSTTNLDQPQQQQQEQTRPMARTSSSSRSQRINLAQSQRDKMRVESQRFDPPSSSTLTTISTTAATANQNQELSSRKSPPSPSPSGLSGAGPRLHSGAAQRSLCDSSSSSSSSCEAAATIRVDNDSSDRQVDLARHFRFATALRGVRGGNSQVSPPLPASLVPLIMMNSDTSTDSSIVTVVTRPVCTREQVVDRPKQVVGQTEANNSSVRAVAVGERKSNHQVTINLSFDERTTTTTKANQNGEIAIATPVGKGAIGKGQILHYNSDKLIQSIVDLSNIHYIDCTANSATAASLNSSDARQDFKLDAAADQRTSNTNHIQQVKTSDNNQLEQHSDETMANDKSAPPSPVVNCAKKSSSRPKASGAKAGAEQQVVVGVPARQQKSMGKKLTKLAKERKAAKTLGIVVGVFILCWLPFFVVNILVALCGLNCIYKPELLFSVVTWLGWLNSAMNPVIYACWSRDFRRAFRRVLCTWVEFLCYDGTRLARKLKLKKTSGYSNNAAQRSGTSVEINITPGGAGSKGAVMRTNSSNNSHKVLLADQ